MKTGSLFSGYGGLDLAVEEVFGAATVWHSEFEDAPSKVLTARWPSVPNLGDVTKIDWAHVEPVDVLTGGFPCQDVSMAGKRAGMSEGTRSGLWFEMCRAIDALHPSVVVIENVRGLLSARTDESREVVSVGPKGGRRVGYTERAVGRVLADLADFGFDAEWRGVRASDVGAPHQRFRVFIVAENSDVAARRERRQPAPGQAEGGRARADAGGRVGASTADSSRDGRDEGWPESAGVVGGFNASERGSTTPHTPGSGLEGHGSASGVAAQLPGGHGTVQWGAYEPAIRRWEHATARRAPNPTEPSPRGGQRLAPRFVEWMMGLPAGWVTDIPGAKRNDQLKMLGNGVVPQQAAAALRMVSNSRENVA